MISSKYFTTKIKTLLKFFDDYVNISIFANINTTKMRVKELLKEKGMTAKELAGILGMTETGLSIAISDKGNPPLKRLEEIAAALGVTIPELFAPQPTNTITCPHCGAVLEIREKK